MYWNITCSFEQKCCISARAHTTPLSSPYLSLSGKVAGLLAEHGAVRPERCDVTSSSMADRHTLCYLTLCYLTLCYLTLCYLTLCYLTLCYLTPLSPVIGWVFEPKQTNTGLTCLSTFVERVPTTNQCLRPNPVVTSVTMYMTSYHSVSREWSRFW